MIRRTMEFQSEGELIAAEQAIAMARELRELADAAPDGHVLAAAEAAALERGRRLTRDRLQDALNAQAADLEKKATVFRVKARGPSDGQVQAVRLIAPRPAPHPRADR